MGFFLISSVSKAEFRQERPVVAVQPELELEPGLAEFRRSALAGQGLILAC